MKLPAAIDGFFFQRIGSRGFSAMRIAWAFIAGAFLLMQWNDVIYYYSDAGVLPRSLDWIVAREDFRFTLLNWFHNPASVFGLYLTTLASMLFMLVGWRPKLFTILSVVLLFSFHERNAITLGGGDTVLRLVGFLLVLAPGIDGFSVSRLLKQWENWKKKGTLLRPPTMPIWPWRLLLWQLIALYATSVWYKLLGTMWWYGTAVEATFHHPVYVRFPMHVMNQLIPMATAIDYLALVWQASWVLLLVPRALIDFMPKRVPRVPLLRWLMFFGIFFHGGILVLMDAGVFSLAMYVAYLGLLRDADIEWLRKTVQKWTGLMPPARSAITVLYDGRCGLCKRSVFGLQIMDWIRRLRFVNFRDSKARAEEAPGVTEASLDKAMHIRLPDGKYLKGFDAARRLAWHLPALWIAIPFLYIPGIPHLGRRIYAKIADNRKKCDHESCAL